MDEDGAKHVRDAIDLMQREMGADWEVVAVEEYEDGGAPGAA